MSDQDCFQLTGINGKVEICYRLQGQRSALLAITAHYPFTPAFILAESPDIVFTLKSGDHVYECDDATDCLDYNDAFQLLKRDKLIEVIEAISAPFTSALDVCERAKNEYGELYNEARANLVEFLVKHSNAYVKGYEAQKRLVVLSVLSSYLPPGGRRLNLLLTGDKSAKDAVVQSILSELPSITARAPLLKTFPQDEVVRVNLSGYVIDVPELTDDVAYELKQIINNNKELVTVSDGKRRIEVYGQPPVIVYADDKEIEKYIDDQMRSAFYRVYVPPLKQAVNATEEVEREMDGIAIVTACILHKELPPVQLRGATWLNMIDNIELKFRDAVPSLGMIFLKQV